jgi:hypothetical protein
MSIRILGTLYSETRLVDSTDFLLRLRATALALRVLRLRASFEVSRCRAQASRALALRGPPTIYSLRCESKFGVIPSGHAADDV